MQQLLKGLSTIHRAGLVHRDIKPHNLVLTDKERVFKLIDLGACACFRTGGAAAIGHSRVPDIAPHYDKVRETT